MQRIAIVAAVLGLAALALWHPVPHPPAAAADPVARASGPSARDVPGRRSGADPVVYVAGAVRRPGLYHLRDGERAGDAVAAAGGETPAAQPWAVNLAQRVRDGDEIYVPDQSERAVSSQARTPRPRGRRSRASPAPSPGAVDVNADDALALGRVPGIGRAIAERIVELRERDGPYASLDELLDVAGMSAGRLERARPFLRPP